MKSLTGSQMGNCLSAHPHDSARHKLRKFYKIHDNFDSIEKVQAALRSVGLESSNLIVGMSLCVETSQ